MLGYCVRYRGMSCAVCTAEAVAMCCVYRSVEKVDVNR